ncbi:MAG: NUDIX domain-containing protein [Anaerolineae bacterium]|jgi:isopentenyldiphosphate isomerase|nr:NUDIX domain-containing protein [Anaerolineae bacterium]
MIEELFDIYDDNLNFLGVKPRSQVHRDGDWHCSIHCWVVSRADRDYLLVQKRAADKDTYPNLFDVSAAGHLSAGETVGEAIRELDEELGLKVPFEALIPLGIRVSATKPAPLMIDREFNYVFLLRHDQPLDSYQPNHEVSGIAWIAIEDGIALCVGEVTTINARYLSTETRQVDTITLGIGNFVPNRDRYLYKVLLIAQRYFAGETHLVI